jgi:hypothetical protein
MAPFKWADHTASIDRQLFDQKVKELRHQALLDKTTMIDKILCEAKPLTELYNQCSLPHGVRALGEGDLNDPLQLHPIVWAINQTGLELSETLSLIWDEQSPDVAPIEYLPIVSTKSYFNTPRKSEHKYLSGIIIDAYDSLSNELNQSH